jgi:MOSC domain-containing protein YiiM
MAHFRRHQLAVAGEDFHGNAAGLQRFQRRGGGLFRRIEEGDVAFEDQIGFVNTLIVAFARGQIFVATATTRSP